MAATTNWSDIVPNFDSMPDAMQQWLVTNLPTFIGQAVQQGLQQGFDQHWGVAATGNSYHLVGTDHTHAVMGDHNEVVGGQTTRTRQDSVMTHNLADEIKVTEGAHSHQVNSDTFYLTLGTENRTVASHQATEVGGDHSLVVSGNSAASAATHTVITGSGNTDDSVVTHSETITGSRYEAVSGTHYIQSGAVVRSVGGTLPTNFTAPSLPPPPPKSNPNGLSDGALAHPGLAQELAPAAPAAAMQSSSQQATTQNSDAQQQPHAVAQKESSNDTKQSKTALTDANMAWQDVTSGAAGIVTAGLALSSSHEPMDFVESTNYKGSIQDNIEGDRVTTVKGKLTDSFLGGADSFTKGSASDTVLGMAGDTIIGLSSDALIGLAMPFTLISMGQVLLNMDEDVCVVESKSFKLDMAGMKITTPGGAVWGGGKATEEAAKLEKAEQLLGDAKKAEDAVKDAQKTKDAAEAIKAEKTAADAKALEKGEEFEKQAKETKELKETAAADRAQKFEEIGNSAKEFEAFKNTTAAEGAQGFEKIEKLLSVERFAKDNVKKIQKASADIDRIWKDVAESDKLEKTAQDAKNVADAEKAAADEKFAKWFPDAAEDAENLQKAKQAATNAPEIEKWGNPLMKAIMKADEILKAGFSVTKDSRWAGSTMKTLLKGFDYAAALKAVGMDADKAAAAVKITKAAYKSITKGVSTGIRGQAGQDQSDNLQNDPKTKQVDGTEEKKPET